MADGGAFHDQKRKTKNEKRLLMIYGIGVDLVKVARIERVLARYGDRFLARVFTDREIAYCRGKSWAAAASPCALPPRSLLQGPRGGVA